MRTPFNVAPVAVKFTDISTAIGTWSELVGHAHAFRCSDVRKSSPPSRACSLAAFQSRKDIPKSFSVILYLPSLTAFSVHQRATGSGRSNSSDAVRKMVCRTADKYGYVDEWDKKPSSPMKP